MDYKVEYSWKRFLKDYWVLLEGKRFVFSVFTILRFIAGLLSFAITFALGMIVDFFTGYSVGDVLTKFYLLVGAIAFFGSLQVWLRFFAKVRMQTIAANIRKETRVAAMSKLIDLELKWHEKEETGSKIQKINQGGESIFQGIKDFSNQGIIILTGSLGSFFLFLGLNWKYAVFALVFMIIYLYGENYFNRKLNYWQDRLNKIKEKVSGKLHESASNVLTVKSLGLKESFEKSTTSHEKKYYDTWVQMRDVTQLKYKTVKIFSALVSAGFVLMIGFDFINGLITLGSILIFADYFQRLVRSMHEITHNMKGFIATKSSVGRFMTIFGIKTFQKDKGTLTFPKNWKKIEFINVWFKYKDAYVLKNFNLVIDRQSKIGVVGKSGCGKSTLVKLLLGLYHPEKGKILIDGKSIRKFTHQSITDNIAIVLQESEMFNLSLLENISISSLKKDLPQFQKAAKIAQLEPLVKKLPKGFHTLIGERGYHLSGGERQRVGIARAIYKDSSLLILDEATASLDSKTESLIQNSIEKNLRQKAILIIAHRLSTLRNVDQIIVMDKGKIVEKGSFNDLIKQKRKFYQMYQLQRNK